MSRLSLDAPSTTGSSRPIRILELRTSDGHGGGPEKTILNGAVAADPRRFAVSVCYIRNARDKAFDVDVRARRLGLDYTEIVLRHGFDPILWPSARQIVRERRIDIVHAHDYKTDLLALTLARAEKIIPLATVHGWTGHGFRERRIYAPVDKRVLARFPLILAVSGTIRDELIRCGTRPDRIRLILNAIDPLQFHRDPTRVAPARQVLGLPPDAVVLGSVGRVEPQKRFDLLIDAFSRIRFRFPNLHLLVAGDGSKLAEMRAEVTRRGLQDSCRFIGHCGAISDFYHALDLFVQSSDYEGTPNVVLEAMALGVPVVATSAGGTAELIADGVHGLIIPTGDSASLASALVRALEDPATSYRFAVQARSRVETELSFERRCRTLEEIYLELNRWRETPGRDRGRGRFHEFDLPDARHP